MLLGTSMAPPLCGEAAVFLAFVSPAMPNHLYIKSRSLSARYSLIRSRFLWLHQCSASFLLLPTATRGANTMAIVGQTPASHGLAVTQGWHCPLPPVSPAWAVGSRSQPWALLQLGLLLAGLRYRTDPSPRRGCRGNYQRPLWSWAISKGKHCLSLKEPWIRRCWGCPHHCTIKEALCFSSCYTGRNIVWVPSTTNPLLDLQAPHKWNNR